MSTSSVVRSRSPTNDSSASTSEKLAGMKTTKNAPTTASRSTPAGPPPKMASPRTPMPQPMGMAMVSATIAKMSRSSLTASCRSLCATSAALRRSRLGQLIVVVAHYREVDVLQGRQLAHLAAHLEARALAQLGDVPHSKRPAGRHDADRRLAVITDAEVLGLVHVVCAD